MDLDYISTRRLSRFYDNLKDWLSLNYSTKVELAEATQDMRGATEQFAGAHGLVPTPAAADRNKFLKGDATWAELPVATTTGDGLMSSTDKTKLDGIATGAQVNVIESVKVAGSALTIDSKSVNVPEAGGTTGAWVKGVVSGEDTARWDSWVSAVFPIIPKPNIVVIGGRTYPTVKIGNQMWMAENLDYAWDGLIINDTGSASEPRAYYYNRGSKDTYGIDGTYKCGLLYNHPAVVHLHNNMESLLPAGWDVPTESDWQALLDAVGGASAALSKLKAKPASVSTEYPPQSWGGTDNYGFNVLPAGFMDNNLYAVNRRTMLWTLSSDSGAYRRCVDFDTNVSAVGFGSFNMLYDLSVRLVKNLA